MLVRYVSAGIDAEIGEELKAERLRAVADQHDIDAADPHGRAVAKRHLGRPEALPAIALEADHPDTGVDRSAGRRPDLAADRYVTWIEGRPR